MNQKIIVKENSPVVLAAGRQNLIVESVDIGIPQIGQRRVLILPTGAVGPQGDPGVVAATGLATYDDQTQTIDVTATAADVGADPAGSAAAVAGDLATHEGLTTTAHGGIVASTDPRLTDARTPTAHTHAQGDVTGLTADLAAKAPTSRLITAGTGLTGGGDLSADRTLTVTYGATAGTAAEGNDARLTNARTPTAHAASHQDGGSDELALDGSQITSGTVAPGRLGSGTPSAGTVLHGDGAWRRGHVDAVANAVTFPGRAPIGPNHAPTSASSSHNLGAVGREAYVPFFCPDGTYDSIGVNVTATAASTWRIGVADMASTGWPGEILLDAGTLDMSTATQWRALAIGFVVDRPRWMWMQVKCTAYTAAPTVTCLDGVSSAAGSPRLPGWPVYGSLLARAFVGCCTLLNRGSGSLDPAAPMSDGNASSGTGLGFAQYSPLIVMRRSA